jgi:SAM-dependent methyltransferase
MVKLAKQVYRAVVTNDQEARTIQHFIRTAYPEEAKKYRVLDVGCGYGRHLRELTGCGFDATGVDTNPDLVRANREAGLRCLFADEFTQTEDTYDVVLMSHVIEHFSPKELVPFLNGYLDRLKVGGRLIIATPLLTRFFYDDFDHVKPYHPMGILMVFGDKRAQVQYYGKHTLRLEDVWIRRGHWRFAHRRARYMNSVATRLIQVAEFGSALAFRLSGGLVGQADGWVGMFQKVDDSGARG